MSKTLRAMFDELIMAVPFTNAEARYIPKIKVALEKQIPKKPIEYLPNSFCCPDCKSKRFMHSPYCEHCGQALDWGGL